MQEMLKEARELGLFAVSRRLAKLSVCLNEVLVLLRVSHQWRRSHQMLTDTKVRALRATENPTSSPIHEACTFRYQSTAGAIGASTIDSTANRKTLALGTYPDMLARRGAALQGAARARQYPSSRRAAEKPGRETELAVMSPP
ncbi:MAG: hypothetical protein U1F39_11295 [Steroidobacteraceae bacterium]